MLFTELNLIEPILSALEAEGYTNPTPIQQKAIPPVLAGKDLLGCAQTGTGKTAAFAIPMLQLLSSRKPELSAQGKKPIRALILTPTRELAIQIQESFDAYGQNLRMHNAVVFGGVNQNPQVEKLRRGIDVLVATPGRLLDLIDQGYVHLNKIEFFVLDEADRMLDMGFVHDVKKIITKLPKQRQTLFFSATMPKEIQSLADSILNNPVKVEVSPVSSTADTVAQAVYFVKKDNKRLLLNDMLKDRSIETILVFTRTKHGADKVVKDLIRSNVTAEAIHGNKSQVARQRALQAFTNRTTRVLVATDIAAKGIDIDEVTHVLNYEVPNMAETYVHRIGRTGRAGSSGIALSFCDDVEVAYLRDIQKLINRNIHIVDTHPYHEEYEFIKPTPATVKQQGQRGGARQQGNGGGRNNQRPKSWKGSRPNRSMSESR
ncbi:MAG: DEAD/DEAH box helicase [Saprospiraceae bacterium]|nr:DEAD/DEAH box helicase [Candidatus Brachybacter algidus]